MSANQAVLGSMKILYSSSQSSLDKVGKLGGASVGFLGISQAQGFALGSCYTQGGRDPSCIMAALVVHAGIVCPTIGLPGGVFGQDLTSCMP